MSLVTENTPNAYQIYNTNTHTLKYRQIHENKLPPALKHWRRQTKKTIRHGHANMSYLCSIFLKTLMLFTQLSKWH